MNLPNQLTLARLGMTALFVCSMTLQFPASKSLALFIFLLATLTDYLDGVIARSQHLITDFGKLMDPLADKILTAAAFILLIPLGAIPAWVVIVIVSREFLITGLRLLANSKNIILPAEKIGKHKTAWQMLTIIFFLFLLSASEFTASSAGWFQVAWHSIGSFLVWITTILTVYSGISYLWKNRSLITEK